MQCHPLHLLSCFVVCTLASTTTNALDIITTVAGDGTNRGFVDLPIGEGGPGPNAVVAYPHYLAVDKTSGSLLISENALIRRLNLSSGTISTVAGLGDKSGFTSIGQAAINLRTSNSFAATLANGTIAIGPMESTQANPIDFYLIEPSTLVVANVVNFKVLNMSNGDRIAINPFTKSQQPSFTQEEFFFTNSQGTINLQYVQRYSSIEYELANNPPVYAGTGIPGFSGDNGAATVAQISSPEHLFCNLSGDLFFRDLGSNRIRCVNKSSQIIRTLYGNGSYNFIIPNSLASNSGLAPGSVFTADTFGNLYISELRIIYKVDPSGFITVVANEANVGGYSGDGGDAKNATMRQISYMTCDSDGNLYIADMEDNRIRKIAFGPRITSSLSANVVQGQPYSYTIVATGSKTITYSTSPAVPGLTLSGNVLSGTPTVPGDYDITLSATNSAATESKVLKLKVISVNAPAPAVITSALTATGTVGTAFSYTLTATGAAPVTLNATGLPSGLAFDGTTISGTPATAGVFSITLSATNVSATDTQTLTLRIDPQPTTGGPGTPDGGGGGGGGPGINLPGAGGSNSVVDTDGDGFSDEMETQLGSDPKNPNSTPMNNKPAGPQSPFDVTKVAIKLSFTSEGKDNLSISGKLPIPDGFVVGGQKVITDVGGVIREFQLNDKGQGGPINDATFKVSIRAKKGVVLAQEAKFSIRIGKFTVGTTFEDEGFPSRAPSVSFVKPVPVAILFNGVSYRSAENLEFTSRNGKTATIK